MSDMRRNMRLVESLLLEFTFTVDGFERKLASAEQLANRGATDSEKEAGKLAMNRLLATAEKEINNVQGNDLKRLKTILAKYDKNVHGFDHTTLPIFATFPKNPGESVGMQNGLGKATVTLDAHDRYDIRFFWIGDDKDDLELKIRQSGFDPSRMILSDKSGYWKYEMMQSYDPKKAALILSKGNYKPNGGTGRGFGQR